MVATVAGPAGNPAFGESEERGPHGRDYRRVVPGQAFPRLL